MVVMLWYKMMNVDFKFGVFIYLFVIEGDNTGCCFFCSCDGSWTPLCWTSLCLRYIQQDTSAVISDQEHVRLDRRGGIKIGGSKKVFPSRIHWSLLVTRSTVVQIERGTLKLGAVKKSFRANLHGTSVDNSKHWTNKSSNE